MIDNLDKAWKDGAMLEHQCKWILGLLSITGRIINDFSQAKQKCINFKLLVFLRTDIMRKVLKVSREPDKIEFLRLRVNDAKTLIRIIEERFVILSKDRLSSEPKFESEDLWERFLPETINGTCTKKFILSNIILRPRDIIYFFNKMKQLAVSRGHEVIGEDDIITAYEEYSSWALTSVSVENEISEVQIRDFMYEFAGEEQICVKDTIVDNAKKAGVIFNEEFTCDMFIQQLVNLTILGIEVDNNKFVYSNDSDDFEIQYKLSGKLNSGRYKIHPAFVPVLMLDHK